MSRILHIETKDNFALVTLASFFKGKWFILLSKAYTSEEKKYDLNDDFSWILQMKEDLEKILPLSKINNTFLSINNSLSIIKTDKKNLKNSINVDSALSEIKKNLIEQYKGQKLSIINFSLDLIEVTPIKKQYHFSYELINQKYLINIENYLKSFGINITRIISIKQSLKKSLEPFLKQDKKIVSVQIEEKFIFINVIQNDNFLLTIKTKKGLEIIYQKISQKYDISLNDAKDIFTKFGNLPLANIIENQIIFNNFNLQNKGLFFLKKDLSKIIKNYIDNVFDFIEEELQNTDFIDGVEIIFSGKLNLLNGFEEYCKQKETSESKISLFSGNIFGLSSNYEIITLGVFYWVEKRIEKINFSHFEKGNLLIQKEIKRKKPFLFIKTKILKYYDYF